MKRILFGSVLGALSVCAANAVDFQVGSPYVALRAKYNTFDMKHLMDTDISGKVPLVGRSTYGAGVAVGARLFDIVRAEFEYDFGFGQKTHDFDVDLSIKESVITHALLASVYYDFNIEQFGPFVPHIGASAGVGIKNITTDVNVIDILEKYTGVDNTFTSFLWCVDAGVSYVLNDKFTIDMGYRYGLW